MITMIEFYNIELDRLSSHIHYQIDRFCANINDSSQSFTEFYESYVMPPSPAQILKTKCCVPSCHKKRGNKTSYCWMHKSRRFKQINPITYVWMKLKYNAKTRGIRFTLTNRYFRLFCWYNDYNVYRGRRDNDYNIDRIDNSKGYERGNIQILTGKSNREKYHEVDKVNKEPEDNLPF